MELNETTYHQKMPDATRAGLIRGLRRYCSGGSIKQAFATDDTPYKSHYYRLKREFPAARLLLQIERAGIAPGA
jgi:hypothetical protein